MFLLFYLILLSMSKFTHDHKLILYNLKCQLFALFYLSLKLVRIQKVIFLMNWLETVSLTLESIELFYLR